MVNALPRNGAKPLAYQTQKPSSYRCEVKWNRIQWRHNIRNKKEKPPKRNVACRKTFPKNSLPRSFEEKCENCVHAAFHLSNFVFFSVSTTVFRPLTYKLLIHSLSLERFYIFIKTCLVFDGMVVENHETKMKIQPTEIWFVFVLE